MDKRHKKNHTTVTNVRRPSTKSKATIGWSAIFMLLLIVLILFLIAHGGRRKEMMYVFFLFVFVATALFSYSYWSAVNRGDGIWQYIGPNNLQHQQVSNPNYHFSSVPNFKGHPKSKVHLVAPPKMGGVKLEIYTLDEDMNERANEPRRPPDLTRLHPQHSFSSAQSNGSVSSLHHSAHRHHHQRNHSIHSYDDLIIDMEPQYSNVGNNAKLSPSSRPLRPGRSCIELLVPPNEVNEEPVKCLVDLPREHKHHHRHHHHHHRRHPLDDFTDFSQVYLPMRADNSHKSRADPLAEQPPPRPPRSH